MSICLIFSAKDRLNEINLILGGRPMTTEKKEYENYLKAKVAEEKGRAQPSRQHEMPIVVEIPGTKEVVYREEL